MTTEMDLSIPLDKPGRENSDRVGGKNASPGEMIGHLREAGIRVPGGSATTAATYCRFIEANELKQPIAEQIGKLKDELSSLHRVGQSIRKRILKGKFLPELDEGIRSSIGRWYLAPLFSTSDLVVH